MANAVSVAPSVNPVVAFVSNAYANFQEARARRSMYYTTLRELQALTNRDLADLGLSRSSIKSIAYEHAYGK